MALLLGVYNLVRRHHSLGTTPAVAAGIEESRWSLERVRGNDGRLLALKFAAIEAEKAAARRLAEDAVFARVLSGN